MPTFHPVTVADLEEGTKTRQGDALYAHRWAGFRPTATPSWPRTVPWKPKWPSWAAANGSTRTHTTRKMSSTATAKSYE